MGIARGKLLYNSGTVFFKSLYKNAFLTGFLILLSQSGLMAQKLTVESPNKKIQVSLFSQQETAIGKWFLKVSYGDKAKKKKLSLL